MRRLLAVSPSGARSWRGKRRLDGGLAAVVVVACFVACAGPNFTNQAAGGSSGTAGSATGGSGAGGTNSGGMSAGGAGSGGASGTAGAGAGATGGSSSGEAGMGGAPDTCRCGPAQYCRAGACFDCADLSKLDFGDVEQVLDYPDGALRFPRAGAAGGSLFYTLVTSSVSELWYGADVATAPGGPISDPRVANEALDYFGDTGSLGFDVLFAQTATDGARSLRAATWDGAKLGAAMDPPVPLAPMSGDDYSPAFAGATGRVYFMTTRDGSPKLVTGTLGSATTKAVDVKLPGQGGGTCSRTGADATPWVTSDGRLLLFGAPPLDASCNPVDGDATDVYVALLNATSGLPLATAVPLTGVNHSSDTSSETDASFSADLCTLYFASDGGEAQGHDFRLYRAFRR